MSLVVDPIMERCIPEECPLCEGSDIIQDWQEGNIVCRGCGLVLEEHLLDFEAEWRTFSDSNVEDPDRVSTAANPLLENDNRTSVGQFCDSKTSRENKALRRTQLKSSVSVSDKIMIKAITRIHEFQERLTLPSSISNRAKELCKEYHNHVTEKRIALTGKLPSVRWSGRELKAVVAASLHIACRKEKAPRTFKEISGVTGVSVKLLGGTVKKIQLAMNSARIAYTHATEDLVTRYCNNLGLTREMSNLADTTSKAIQDLKGITGKTDATIAATSILLVSHFSPKNYQRTVAEISKATGVAERTIRETYIVLHSQSEAVMSKIIPQQDHTALPQLPK